MRGQIWGLGPGVPGPSWVQDRPMTAGSRLGREEVKIFDPLGGHAKKVLHAPGRDRGRRMARFWSIFRSKSAICEAGKMMNEQ